MHHPGHSEKSPHDPARAGIAVIGHGAVAQALVRGLPAGTVRAVLCRPGREAAARAALGVDLAVSAAGDVPSGLDCVVDCGGHAALRAHGATLLAAGCDVITVSLGALADAGLADALEAAALSGGARLTLASGAIGGLDALAAAACGRLERVTYTGRKPPVGWAGSPAEQVLDLGSLAAPAVHFEGSARACALAYPKNANVAAAVALAGIGLDATEARLVADPGLSGAVHEVVAEGDFGHFRFEIAGQSLPGAPRSSALTAMSLIHAVTARARAVGL